jgi:hypothetical protein
MGGVRGSWVNYSSTDISPSSDGNESTFLFTVGRRFQKVSPPGKLPLGKHSKGSSFVASAAA